VGQWLQALTTIGITYLDRGGKVRFQSGEEPPHERRPASPDHWFHPVERLQSLRSAVDGRIVFTTSFGIEAQALDPHDRRCGLDIELATLDTGRLFPSTYKLWAETEQRYGLKIQSFHPDPGGWRNSSPKRGSTASMTAGRRARAAATSASRADGACAGRRICLDRRSARRPVDARSGLKLATWDAERALIKVTPLFDWTREAIADFCAAHDVPINPLHAKAFRRSAASPAPAPSARRERARRPLVVGE
jgi:phosphoadenosine phosphosulfate reductase